jgi:hypothetical protein
MGAISNAINGLSYLTQPGGVLSNQPAPIVSELQSAPQQDVVSLSDATLEAQEVSGIFGLPQPGQNTAVTLPALSPSTTKILPGVSNADLSNATPQQQATINTEAVHLQEAQGLFGNSTKLPG